MSTDITWFGHSNFLVKSGGVSVLVDPFFTGNPTCPVGEDHIEKVDLVLVTHDHGDHVGDAIAICNRLNVLCGCVVGTGDSLIQAGLRQELVPAGMGFNVGGTLNHCGISVTMTKAFHTSESGVPVGYVVTMPGGFTFYHAGDTGLFGDMSLVGSLNKPDVAMLPCGGFFTMDGRHAAEAAKLLGVPAVIPMHYGTFPLIAPDASELHTHMVRVVPACKLLTMKPGETITMEHEAR